MSDDSKRFEVGDTVRLNSGSPPMTVVEIRKPSSLAEIAPLPGEPTEEAFVCAWFEGNRYRSMSFPAAALEAAKNANASIQVTFVKPKDESAGAAKK